VPSQDIVRPTKVLHPQFIAATVRRTKEGPLDIPYTPHPALMTYVPFVDGLARAMGPDCEIVLHDLGHPSNSLIHIAGSVTGRSRGAPVTNLSEAPCA